MKFELRTYQKTDIERWVRNNYRGGWYWDPGLGKTFTAAVVARRLLKKGRTGKIFIGGPEVAMSTWYDFLTRVAGIPEEMIFNHSNPKHEKRGYANEPVIMCNFEKLPPPPDKKRKTHKVVMHVDENGMLKGGELVAVRNNRKIRVFPEDIDTWFLDECHLLKEHDSNAFKFFSRYVKKEHKLLMLSGTPFPNRHVSCYGQLTLMEPGIVGRNISAFRRDYCRLINAQYETYAVRKDMVPVLESKINRLCCFKTVEEHLDIPPLTFGELRYHPSLEQKGFIQAILAKRTVVDVDGRAITVKAPSILHTMGQQVLSGYVDMRITPQFSEFEKAHISMEFGDGPKVDILLQHLEVLAGRKVIIWVNFTETSDRLKQRLLEAGYKVDRFAADDKKNFMDRIDAFVNGDVQILISHPKIIGISVNHFISIRYMIWYEMTWDWAVYEQAVTRIYRGGQTAPTFCWHMIGHELEKRQMESLQQKEDVHNRLSSLDLTNVRDDF